MIAALERRCLVMSERINERLIIGTLCLFVCCGNCRIACAGREDEPGEGRARHQPVPRGGRHAWCARVCWQCVVCMRVWCVHACAGNICVFGGGLCARVCYVSVCFHACVVYLCVCYVSVCVYMFLVRVVLRHRVEARVLSASCACACVPSLLPQGSPRDGS